MLWVIFAVLTGAAIFSVLWPLSRAPVRLDPRAQDVDFYKAQTAEIERDVTRGVIGADEAEVARNEAARRLVSASHRGVAEGQQASPWVTRTAAIGSLVFVPALALGLYWQIGMPKMPDEPLEARLNAPAANMDMATAIARIEKHLLEHPDDGRGWAVLAPIYLRLQRFDDAQRALSNVIRLVGPSGDRYAALGEAQVNAGGGTISAEAKHSFEEAVKLEPKSPRANFYLGLAAEQQGDKSAAVAIWRKIIADSPPDAPWIPTVKGRIAAALGEPMPQVADDGGPQGKMAEAVAAMPQDKQQAMIHRMVDGLAERLKSNGNDIDGWLRLVRAYRVLNEGDKAKVALTDAKRTFASNPDATKRLDELAHELGLEG